VNQRENQIKNVFAEKKMLFLGLLEAVGCGGVNLCKRVLGMQIGLDGEIGLPQFLLLRFQDDEVHFYTIHLSLFFRTKTVFAGSLKEALNFRVNL